MTSTTRAPIGPGEVVNFSISSGDDVTVPLMGRAGTAVVVAPSAGTTTVTAYCGSAGAPETGDTSANLHEYGDGVTAVKIAHATSGTVTVGVSRGGSTMA